MSVGRGRPRRTWPQRLVVLTGLTAMVVALVGAAALGYLNTKLADVQRLALSGVLTKPDPAPGAPQNFLIVGTDSDLGLADGNPAKDGRGQVSGIRSDTIMILHVDPAERSASLLSLPRDLWVEIAGEGIHQRLNYAVGLGGDGVAGPIKLIETIQSNFQIPINHYVEIDFHGFEQVVETIGGVPIYFNTGIRDRDEYGVQHTIIDIPKPGCYVLDAPHALAYARTRHLEMQRVPGDSSSWVADPTADIGRISRQQDFVKRVLKRAVAKGMTDPVAMNRLINTGLTSVRVDTDLTAGDLISLGGRFRSFDPDELVTVQLPTYPTFVGAASVVKLVLPEAEAVLAQFRGVPSDPSTATAGVEVQVFNGTGRTNEASAVTTDLSEVGFRTAQPADNLGVTDSASIIRYVEGQEAQAHLLARYLRSDVTYELVETPTWQTSIPPVILITGTSYTGVYPTAQSDEEVPAPTTTTSTTTTSTTSSVPGGTQPSGPTTTMSTTSTTSVLGYVPGDPPPGEHCG